MTAIPTDYQMVSTFVLSDYKPPEEHVHVRGFAILFLIACACALIISIMLVSCICYKVCRRVFRHRVVVTDFQDPVPGELVKATVVRGTPVGQRVDVVIVRGEAVDQK